ncbi:M23 family metallopeptidase [Sinomonas sp. G460-2]|uniref:M23 family metallopeptidase n=1 Tax=Sinomonas sp. G460-2 TaxID=3393464 RepID=UPI0039F0E307
MLAPFAGARLALALALLVPWLVLPWTAPPPGSPPRAASPWAAPSAGWEWPLAPRPAVVRSFDAPEKPWLAGHRGVDLAASPEQELRSPTAGVVAFAGTVVDRPVVTIDHGNGLRSSFEPIETTLAAGTRVAAGQTLGRLSRGDTHCRAGPCVHWGVREGEDYVDPLKFVADTRPSVLLPWGG